MATLFETAAAMFGWKIIPQEPPENPVSFAPPEKDDGAVTVAAGGTYGQYLDLEGSVRTEAELVTKYRDMSLKPEVESAIEDIVNEAIVMDDEYIVRINTDKLPAADEVKDRIREEFEEILDLMDFDNNAFEIFKRWYVDGRMYYHAIIDDATPEEGLVELRYIDPRKIRKIREEQTLTTPTGVMVKKTVQEYFIYNDRGFPVGSAGVSASGSYGQTNGLKIAIDTILHITSGIMDTNNQLVLSHLHKAIKPLNQLSTLEDATLIYRISRAPERRVFYIDVGNLPKAKAEQYVRDIMVRHKNRLVYDAATGEVRDDRKYMTMLEDYWFPRREGGKSTEVTTMDGGQNLGELSDVNYFLKRLMHSLNVPISRLEPDQGFSLGRTSEISRDEIKFSKFVDRIRRRFCKIFILALEKQLVLKGVCTKQEWQDFARHVTFDFQEDNHFAELKDAEILQSRLQLAQQIEMYIGKYYSFQWFRRNVLRQSDEEIEDMDRQIEEEEMDPKYQKLKQGMMSGMGMGMGMGGMGPDGMPFDMPGQGLPPFDNMGGDGANPQLNGIGDSGGGGMPFGGQKTAPGDASKPPANKKKLPFQK